VSGGAGTYGASKKSFSRYSLSSVDQVGCHEGSFSGLLLFLSMFGLTLRYLPLAPTGAVSLNVRVYLHIPYLGNIFLQNLFPQRKAGQREEE